MNDFISRKSVSRWLEGMGHKVFADIVRDDESFPPVDAAPVNIDGDGTLMVTVGKNANISRVIVLYGDSIFCGVFYPDGEKDGDGNEAD